MKMNELMNEGPVKKVEKGAKLAGATSDLIGAGGEWVGNQLRKLDPRQIWNKDIKTTYSSVDSKPGGVLDTYKTQLAAAEKQAEKNAAQVARQEKADARIEKLDKMRDKMTTRGRDTSRLDNIVGRQDAISKDAAGKIVTPTKVDKPDPTTQSLWKWSAPVGGAELGYRAATSSEADPSGDSLVDLGTDIVGAGVRKIFGTPAGITQGALKDRDAGDEVDGAAQEKEKRDASDSRTVSTDTKESISDILKLSGQKSITERDNVAGIIKPKEIVALHESTQLEECGMMTSTPNQTASLSINATAGNGQEVANMLAAIMNLAGVKPVTGDMLGSSPMPPMPIVKAIDIISRGDSDSMNSHDHDHDHDHNDKETLTGGMEEEYGNTPADPTKVPDLDTNKLAYQPNNAKPRDRMDGTMPKGFPTMTHESLQQAYQQFKNGQ